MKKPFFFLCILLSSLICPAGGGLQIFTSGSFQGLADSKGEVVIPAVYDALGWSDGSGQVKNNVIGYKEDNKWGLIHIKNKKVTEPDFATLVFFSGELFDASIKGKFSNRLFHGLIDDRGKVLVDFKYFYIESLPGDRILVSDYRDGSVVEGVYSLSGEQIIPISFRNVEQVGRLFKCTNSIHQIKLYDPDGQPVIDEWLDAIMQVAEGFLIFDKGKVGFVDHSGNVVYHPEFKSVDGNGVVRLDRWEIRPLHEQHHATYIDCDSLTFEGDGLWIAHVNNAQQMLGASGTIFSDRQNMLKYIGRGYLVAQNSSTGMWGIYKTDGAEVKTGLDSVAVDAFYFYGKHEKGWDIYNLFGRKINEKPLQAVGYSLGRNLPVKQYDSWGWLDFQGGQLIDYKYDFVEPGAHPGQFIAAFAGKWGVAAFDNTWKIIPEYDNVTAFQNLYIARKGQSRVVFDHHGNELYRTGFMLALDDFAGIRDGNLRGVITGSGFVVEPAYDKIDLWGGSYYELRKGPYVEVIRASGEKIVSEQDRIEKIIALSEGYFHIVKDGKHGFIDENGKLRIANRYDSAIAFSEGLGAVKLLGKWGFVDKRESLVIQPFYDEVSDFSSGLAIVSDHGKYGLINVEGEEVISPKFAGIERLGTGHYKLLDEAGREGLADEDGRILLRPNYDKLIDTPQNLVIATKGNKKGVLDYNGYSKVPFDYEDIKIEGDYLLLLKSDPQ